MKEQIGFLRRFLASPRSIGAVLPSGQALAEAMVSAIETPVQGPVLELGSGTGVFTEALLTHGIAPSRVIAVEYDPHLAGRVRRRCPGVRVIEEDAFSMSAGDHALHGPYAAVVSGIPLLNHSPKKRRAFVSSLLDAIMPGASLLQFSYGLRPPVQGLRGVEVRKIATVWRNMPPARVWSFTRRAVECVPAG